MMPQKIPKLTEVMADADADRSERCHQRDDGQERVHPSVWTMSVRPDHVADGQGKVSYVVAH